MVELALRAGVSLTFRKQDAVQELPAELDRSRRQGRELIATADSILEHRFPILGVTIDTGPEIDWRRDYLQAVCE